MAYDYTTCLFITYQIINDFPLLQIGYNQIDTLKGTFDLIILNLNKSLYDKNEAEKVNILLKIFSKLKTRGNIYISKNTYELLASGRRGVEALIKLLDYNIDLPPYFIRQYIIASNKRWSYYFSTFKKLCVGFLMIIPLYFYNLFIKLFF